MKPCHVIRTTACIIAALFLLKWPAAAQSFSAHRYVSLIDPEIVTISPPWPINPATPAGIDRALAAVYAGQAYGLPELRYGSAALLLPTSFGVATFFASSLGRDLYRESFYNLILSRSISPGSSRPFYVGIAGTVKSVSIASYGTEPAYGLSMGYAVEIWPSLFLGFSFSNLLRSAGAIQLARRFFTGLGYRLAPATWMLTSIATEPGFPTSFSAGFEHKVGSLIHAHIGVATSPDRVSIGISLPIGPLQAGMMGERHSDLGWTPAVSVNLQLARQKESP